MKIDLIVLLLTLVTLYIYCYNVTIIKTANTLTYMSMIVKLSMIGISIINFTICKDFYFSIMWIIILLINTIMLIDSIFRYILKK